MAFASTSDAKLYIAEQASFGSSPGSGYQYIRYTGESIAFAAETATSEEISTSRGISDVIRTAGGSSGDIEFELSYDAVTDMFLEGALQDNSFAGGDQVLQNGSTQTYYTIEKEFVGTATDYFLMKDAAVSTFAINIEQGAIITGTVGLLGSTLVSDDDSVTGSAITAAGSNAVMSAVDTETVIKLTAVDTTSWGGISAQTNVQSASFLIDNTLREQRRIGTSALAGIGAGRFNVTGTLVLYFESNDEYANFMSETARSLYIECKQGAVGYVFEFPKIKYTTAEVLAGGIDEDVLVSFEWQGLESATNKTMKVTRDTS